VKNPRGFGVKKDVTKGGGGGGAPPPPPPPATENYVIFWAKWS